MNAVLAVTRQMSQLHCTRSPCSADKLPHEEGRLTHEPSGKHQPAYLPKAHPAVRHFNRRSLTAPATGHIAPVGAPGKSKTQHTQMTHVLLPQRMPRLLRCPHSPAAHPARPAGTSDDAGRQVDNARALRVRLDVVIAAHRARTVMPMRTTEESAEQGFPCAEGWPG